MCRNFNNRESITGIRPIPVELTLAMGTTLLVDYNTVDSASRDGALRGGFSANDQMLYAAWAAKKSLKFIHFARQEQKRISSTCPMGSLAHATARGFMTLYTT